MSLSNPVEKDEERRLETAPLRSTLASTIVLLLGEQEELETAIPGLTLVKRSSPQPQAYMYEPSLSMIVQGGKRVVLGNTTYFYDESRFLLTSLNLPTVTQVLQAGSARLYVSVLFDLICLSPNK